jgi:hypothetical protein
VLALVDKLCDFQRFGIDPIWVIDPKRRLVWRYNEGSLEMVTCELAVPGTPIHIKLDELFPERCP